jgi:preprotein translocase subunit SecA
MDMLKEGIGLRAYGQKDPLLEYKREAFETFGTMMEALGEEVVRRFFRISIVRQEDRRPPEVAAGAASGLAPRQEPARMRTEHQALGMFGRGATGPTATSAPPAAREPVKTGKKVGRNDPCPCGSGQKYKKCHGARG